MAYCPGDGLIIRCSIFIKGYFSVINAPINQTAAGVGILPDNIGHSVIRFTTQAKQAVARLKQSEQARGNGMSAGNDLGTDQGIFPLKDLGKYVFQSFAPDVAVAVAGRRVEMAVAQVMFSKGLYHFNLIKVSDFIQFPKTVSKLFFRFPYDLYRLQYSTAFKRIWVSAGAAPCAPT